MPVSAFITGERSRAAAWKATTPTLPDDARADGSYRLEGGKAIDGLAYCLPHAFADLNLLPDARQPALEAFAALGIEWQGGGAGTPSNHLLASQVQCANALAPLLHDPDGLRRLFGQVLPIGEVLPIEHGWYATFEWIGEADHLGEGRGAPRSRGRRTTSADAAIRYATPDDQVEVALIEWKYVEDYGHKPLSHGDIGLELRMARYRPIWESSACPVDTSAVAYGELFAEPRYQLMRLQMLAARMEACGELGASAVRLVVAAPGRNLALRPDLRRWPRLLNDADRFAVLDTDSLLRAAAPTSEEYRARYG